MSDDFAMALPRHVCPVCLVDRPFDEPIVNKVLSKEAADEVKSFHNAIVGISVSACKTCKKLINEDEIFFIEVNEVELMMLEEPVTFLNTPRTGRVFAGPIVLIKGIPKADPEVIQRNGFMYVGSNIIESIFNL